MKDSTQSGASEKNARNHISHMESETYAYVMSLRRVFVLLRVPKKPWWSPLLGTTTA